MSCCSTREFGHGIPGTCKTPRRNQEAQVSDDTDPPSLVRGVQWLSFDYDMISMHTVTQVPYPFAVKHWLNLVFMDSGNPGMEVDHAPVARIILSADIDLPFSKTTPVTLFPRSSSIIKPAIFALAITLPPRAFTFCKMDFIASRAAAHPPSSFKYAPQFWNIGPSFTPSGSTLRISEKEGRRLTLAPASRSFFNPVSV